MSRIQTIAILAISLIATFGAGSAEAGRPRMIVLDEDVLAVTHDVEFETWASLTLLRAPSGRALLMDTRPNEPVVVRPLGFTVPPAGVFASYVEGPDGAIWAAISWGEHAVVVTYDMGDTATHEVGHWMGITDPSSTQLGIIAVLIALAQEPVETVAISLPRQGWIEIQGWDWESSTFAPVELRNGRYYLEHAWP